MTRHWHDFPPARQILTLTVTMAMTLCLAGCPDGPRSTGADRPPAASDAPPAADRSEQAPAAPSAPARPPESAPPEPLPPIDGSRDYHSHANADAARVTHVSLVLTVDFDRQVLDGQATLDIDRVDPAVDEVVLDTRRLTIHGVDVAAEDGVWVATAFVLGEADPVLGAPLRVTLPATAPGARVRIRYTTSPEAPGLQWLGPKQTTGGQHPFLYTQSQAIQARSWIPLQDTPAVRVTYEAIVNTPQVLRAVMSASNDAATPLDGVYQFEMSQPVPSYLIALAVGDLRYEEIGARTGVYAEPSLLKAAAAEFADTESMLEQCELLFGPYQWQRYDLVIMPPSFPLGGMENPRLSFITPTVVAGDKSLVALIAHELAHSWSGNLVTNATWRDLWLNEGFTTYLTSRIMGAVYGPERAAMEDLLNYQELLVDLADLPAGDEVLAIDLRGRDPDDALTEVPYTKGQLFLVWLESRVGRQNFDAFVKGYFHRFGFQSIDTDRFVDYLDQNLLALHPGAASREEVDAWIFQPGLPDDAVLPESDAFDRVAAVIAGWLAGERSADQLPVGDWSVHEWRYFLTNLPRSLDRERLAELDSAFGLTATANSEVAHAWLLIAVRNDYEPAFDRLRDYLVGIGRRRLIVPLYEELAKTPRGRDFGRSVYEVARPGYHPLARTTVDAIFAKALP